MSQNKLFPTARNTVRLSDGQKLAGMVNEIGGQSNLRFEPLIDLRNRIETALETIDAENLDSVISDPRSSTA